MYVLHRSLILKKGIRIKNGNKFEINEVCTNKVEIEFKD